MPHIFTNTPSARVACERAKAKGISNPIAIKRNSGFLVIPACVVDDYAERESRRKAVPINMQHFIREE